MPDSEKTNLARIRDNQRRSRARRKEYLQEIETRLRQCELTGIEASSEIQNAARKVIEENRRLRLLLAQHCVTPDDTSDEDGCQPPRDAGWIANTPKSEDAQALESLLSVRRRKCCDPQESPPATKPASTTPRDQNIGGAASSPNTQVSWMPSPESLQDQAMEQPESTGLGHNTSQTAWAPSPESFQGQGLQQFGRELDQGTPGSTYSFTTQCRGVNCCTQISEQRAQLQPPPQIQPGRLPGVCNTSGTLPTQERQRTVYGYAQQAPNTPNQFRHLEQQQTVYNTTVPTYQSPQPPQIQPSITSGLSFQPSGYVTATPTYTTHSQAVGTNSCIYAADLISTIAGGVLQSDVRNDLGCSTQCGTDCEVSNQVVFDVMDRYSGTG